MYLAELPRRWSGSRSRWPSVLLPGWVPLRDSTGRLRLDSSPPFLVERGRRSLDPPHRWRLPWRSLSPAMPAAWPRPSPLSSWPEQFRSCWGCCGSGDLLPTPRTRLSPDSCPASASSSYSSTPCRFWGRRHQPMGRPGRSPLGRMQLRNLTRRPWLSPWRLCWWVSCGRQNLAAMSLPLWRPSPLARHWGALV